MKHKNYLEKIPFDYYDFFNFNYVQGMSRAMNAKLLYEIGLTREGMIFKMLVSENLINMKAITRIPITKRSKK